MISSRLWTADTLDLQMRASGMTLGDLGSVSRKCAMLKRPYWCIIRNAAHEHKWTVDAMRPLSEVSTLPSIAPIPFGNNTPDCKLQWSIHVQSYGRIINYFHTIFMSLLTLCAVNYVVVVVLHVTYQNRVECYHHQKFRHEMFTSVCKYRICPPPRIESSWSVLCMSDMYHVICHMCHVICHTQKPCYTLYVINRYRYHAILYTCHAICHTRTTMSITS
jgi:hypothetical protein